MSLYGLEMISSFKRLDREIRPFLFANYQTLNNKDYETS